MAIGKLPKGALDRLESQFQSNKSFDDALENDYIDTVILEYLNTVIEQMRQKAFEMEHFASGELNRSFDAEAIEVDGLSKRFAILYAKYGDYINDGTKPIGVNWKKGKKRQKRDEAYYKSKIMGLVHGQSMLSSLTRYSQARKFKFDNAKAQYAWIWKKMYNISKYGVKGSGWLDELFGPDNEILEKSFSEFVEKLYGRALEVSVVRLLEDGNNSK